MSFLARTIFATLFLLFCDAANAQLGPFSYFHITTNATFNVKNGSGILYAVCINTVATGETITVYDNTAASGTQIAVFTVASGQIPGCVNYAARILTGLTVVTGVAAGDLTIMFQ